MTQRKEHRAEHERDRSRHGTEIRDVEGEVAHDDRVRDPAAPHEGRDEVAERTRGGDPARDRKGTRRYRTSTAVMAVATSR
jgi:hypothetical protein